MSRHLRLATTVSLLLFITMVPVALALDSGQPDQKATVTYGSSTPGPNVLSAAATGSLSACNPKSALYMQWGLTNAATHGPISGITTPTKLTLAVSGTSGNTGAMQFTLYGIADADEGWDPNTLNGGGSSTAPPIATTPNLGSAAISGSPGSQVVVFDSTTNAPNLVGYLNNKAISAGHKGTLVLILTGCSIGGAAATFSGANLQMFNATAVTMSTFHAADPAVNWPLIVGLGALAAVAVGGVAVSRRRAARG